MRYELATFDFFLFKILAGIKTEKIINTMKTTVEHNNKEQEIKYPFIGITNTGEVVLFYEREKGICIEKGNSCHWVGYYSETWVMSVFKPLNGKITLEND